MAEAQATTEAPIIIYPSVWKLLALAFVWGCAAAFCVWGALQGIILAVPFIALFTCAALYGVYRAILRSPVVIIDQEGIYHNVLGMRPQRIGWVDINSVGRCVLKPPPSLLTLRYLAVYPKNPKAFLAQQTGLLRWLLHLYMATSPAPIMIPQHFLPVSIEWILQQMRARYSPPMMPSQFWDDEKPRR
jgi:hypothetical protein